MGVKILIVEDSKLTREAIKSVTALRDYKIVDEAIDGEDAIRKYKRHKPDIVLMDLALPMMSGIDAIRAIIDYDPNAKIIAVSALYSNEKKTAAMDAGAIEYVVKPFELHELLDAIDKVLKVK
jgi:two-component system chemotaxis response regulator CheY